MSNDQLAACLLATLDPSTETRRAAEAALDSGGKQPGFAVALITIALNQDAAPDLRQLALIVLKKHIKEHWTPEGYKFAEPMIGEEEKAQARALLPAGLRDNNTKINTAVAMAVAEIAKWDCPQQWPELLPGLVGAITDKADANLVNGAVRAFGMFVDELGEEQVMEIAPVLLPEMLHIVGSTAHSPDLRCRALAIFKSILEVMDVLGRTRQAEVKAFLGTSLPQWMQAFAAILAAPTTAEAAELWGVKQQCLGCLVKLVPVFGKLVAGHLPPVMSAAWGMFVACLPLYQAVIIADDDEAGGVDLPAGVDPSSLEDMVTELFELVLALVGSPRFLPVLRPSLPQLAYLTLGYMQMSGEQAERWGRDANAYLSEENDEFWGVRPSGEMLLDELIDTAGDDGIAAVAQAVQRRADEAAAARAAGAPAWWLGREAVLLGLGAVADRLLDAKEMGIALPPQLDPAALAAAVLSEDLTRHASPFVAGRALWLVSKMAPALPPALRPAVLAAAAAALGPGSPPAVQIGGCQALARLCRKAGAGQEVAAVSEQVFSGLCALLAAATEESLHLVLETLSVVVKADPAGAARWEPLVTPEALKAWVDNVVDPLVGEDASDLLQALARVPACLPALQQRMLPTLCNAVARPEPHSPFLVSGALDMLVMLLAPSPPEAAQAIIAAATQPTLSLLASTDEEEVAASGTALLRTLLQVGGARALGWGGMDPTAALQSLLQAVQHLLRPEASDLACRNVGGLILELLRHAGPEVAPYLPALLGALCQKLAVANDPATVQSLVVVLAHLARSDTAQLVECLGAAHALQPALQKWADRQMEIRTPYDIRLTTTALGALLACPHPILDSVTVRGKRIDTGGTIRTRTRAAQQAEQWSHVALRVKLVMLLADAFIEATTQEVEAEDEEDDGEWEEESNGIAVEGNGYSANQLAKLIDGLDSDDDADDLEELLLGSMDPLEAERRKGDPVSSLDIAAYVADLFRAVAAARPDVMQAGAAELTPTQMATVQRIWQQ